MHLLNESEMLFLLTQIIHGLYVVQDTPQLQKSKEFPKSTPTSFVRASNRESLVQEFRLLCQYCVCGLFEGQGSSFKVSNPPELFTRLYSLLVCQCQLCEYLQVWFSQLVSTVYLTLPKYYAIVDCAVNYKYRVGGGNQGQD